MKTILIAVTLICLFYGCVDREKQATELYEIQLKTWNIERFIDTVSWLKYGSKFPTIPDGVDCSISESTEDLTKYKISISYRRYTYVCVKNGVVVSVWKNEYQ